MSNARSLPCVENLNLYHLLEENQTSSDKVKTVVRISEEALEKLKEVAEKYGDKICERINCGYGAFVNHIIHRIIGIPDNKQEKEDFNEDAHEEEQDKPRTTFSKYCNLHWEDISRIKGEQGKNFRKVKINIYIEKHKLELFKLCVSIWEGMMGLKTHRVEESENKHEYEYKYSKPNVSRAVDVIIRFCPKIWES